MIKDSNQRHKKYLKQIYKKFNRNTMNHPIKKIDIERKFKEKHLGKGLTDLQDRNNYIFAQLDLVNTWNLDLKDDIRVQSLNCLTIIYGNLK